LAAGRRRLREELGISADLCEGPAFVYRAEDPGRGVEYEYDTLLYGPFEGQLHPNPEEVAACRWIAIEELRREMVVYPHQFAPWLHLGLPILLDELPGRRPNGFTRGSP
jgi:isopentenyldiphosphate isomerase